jgi:AcrR family transcriptional regulator
MKPKEKRTLERKQVYDRRRLEIIQAARLVFSSAGIDSTKMTDIADKAEMGVASVYRYFNTKSELVIEVGIDYCREMMHKLRLSEAFDRKNGMERVTELLEWLTRLSREDTGFITFLQQFDFYFSVKENRHPRLCDFEEEISKFFPFWFDAVEKGITDGSIREDVSVFDFAALVFRSIVSLQQRVLTRDYILPIDEKLDRTNQMDMLKEMIICYLSKK